MNEIYRLDRYLSSDESPDGSMLLSDLDGFLHGIICSPVAIEPREWFPIAFGGQAEEVPDWVIEETLSLFHDIKLGLSEEPPELGLIFWRSRGGHEIAMDWCEGFMIAAALRPKEWLRLTESGTHGHLMLPLLVHLIDDEGNSAMGISQEDLDDTLDAASKEIPNAIAEIYQFWRERG